jgi:membrane protein implicated in regulation of membrane protease activity
MNYFDVALVVLALLAAAAGLTTNAIANLGFFATALFSLALFPDPIALAFFVPSAVALWLTLWRSCEEKEKKGGTNDQQIGETHQDLLSGPSRFR